MESASEESHSHVQKHQVLRYLSKGLGDIFCGLSRGIGKVVRVVVGQNNAAKEKRHDAAERNGLRESVSEVGEEKQEADFMLWQ